MESCSSKAARLIDRKARAMQYALSALKRMESAAHSRLIEVEIDLPCVLPGRPTQQFPTDHQEPNARAQCNTTCLAKPNTGSQPRACYRCFWRIGWVGPGNGALGQISGSERRANLI
jgi:hypothetical protein